MVVGIRRSYANRTPALFDLLVELGYQPMYQHSTGPAGWRGNTVLAASDGGQARSAPVAKGLRYCRGAAKSRVWIVGEQAWRVGGFMADCQVSPSCRPKVCAAHAPTFRCSFPMQFLDNVGIQILCMEWTVGGSRAKAQV